MGRSHFSSLPTVRSNTVVAGAYKSRESTIPFTDYVLQFNNEHAQSILLYHNELSNIWIKIKMQIIKKKFILTVYLQYL